MASDALHFGVILICTGSIFAQSNLSLTSGSVKVGESVILNLSLTTPVGQMPPVGIQWETAYSMQRFNVLTVQAVTSGSLLNCSAASGRYTCILIDLANQPLPNGVVARLTFTAAPWQGQPSQMITIGSTLAASQQGDGLPLSGATATVQIRKN